MTHLFITRIAVELGGSARITKTQHREYSSPNDRIDNIIKYWLSHASKFYTRQTKDCPFRVYLIYSGKYKDVIMSHTFPEWVTLSTNKNLDRPTGKVYEKYLDQRISVSRIDADDWYSDDYFDYLSTDHKPTDLTNNTTTVLHQSIRFFCRYRQVVSKPVYFPSPPFGSIIFNKYLDAPILRFRLWPHGNIIKRPHLVPDKCHAMQSVGCNVVNKWRHSAHIETTLGDIDNFYIPTTEEGLL